MKPVQATLHQTGALLLVLVVARASCAVFFTNSNDNYPRLGRRAALPPTTHTNNNYTPLNKRAFFTGENKGSSYPRIGRRSEGSSTRGEVPSDRYLQTLLSKRGIFTGSIGDFPRVGRGAEEGHPAAEVAAAVLTSAQVSDMLGAEDGKVSELPLRLLFLQFDTNGDKTLSSDEFVSGVEGAVDEETLYG